MTSPRCRAKDHRIGGCGDPRCPERLYREQTFATALQQNDVEVVLAAKPSIEPDANTVESFASGFWDRATRRARMTAAKAKQATEPRVEPPAVLGSRIRDYERKYREQMLAGIQADAKLRVDPKTGKKTVSIYRSGVVAPPASRGVEAESYLDCDTRMPAGRVGRTRGVFASVSLDTGTRWLHGNKSTKMADYDLRELTVDPDNTYIYSVSNWERASGSFDSRNYSDNAKARHEADVDNFWSQSMTLTSWYDYMRANPEVDPRDWEILVDAEAVQKVKTVSYKRLIDNCFRKDDQRELIEAQKTQRLERRNLRLYGAA